MYYDLSAVHPLLQKENLFCLWYYKKSEKDLTAKPSKIPLRLEEGKIKKYAFSRKKLFEPLSSYEEIYNFLKQNKSGKYGMGFVLYGSPYMFIDVDNCSALDQFVSGELISSEQFLVLLKDFPRICDILKKVEFSYVERSVGKRGLHIVSTGPWPYQGNRSNDILDNGASIEIYDGSDIRYMTMSGDTICHFGDKWNKENFYFDPVNKSACNSLCFNKPKKVKSTTDSIEVPISESTKKQNKASEKKSPSKVKRESSIRKTIQLLREEEEQPHKQDQSSEIVLAGEDGLDLFEIGIKSELFQSYYETCSETTQKDFEQVKTTILNHDISREKFTKFWNNTLYFPSESEKDFHFLLLVIKHLHCDCDEVQVCSLFLISRNLVEQNSDGSKREKISTRTEYIKTTVKNTLKKSADKGKVLRKFVLENNKLETLEPENAIKTSNLLFLLFPINASKHKPKPVFSHSINSKSSIEITSPYLSSPGDLFTLLYIIRESNRRNLYDVSQNLEEANKPVTFKFADYCRDTGKEICTSQRLILIARLQRLSSQFVRIQQIIHKESTEIVTMGSLLNATILTSYLHGHCYINVQLNNFLWAIAKSSNFNYIITDFAALATLKDSNVRTIMLIEVLQNLYLWKVVERLSVL